MKLENRILTGLALSAFAVCGYAQSISCNTIYGLATNVTGAGATTSGQVCAKTAQQFIDLTNSSGLQSINPNYTNTSAFTAQGLFNSVLINLSSPAASPTLTFSVPQLGITQSFTGVTRDDSQSQLGDYLKKNNVLGQIMKLQAQTSPTSSISGQGGLIPTMISSQFDQNFTQQATDTAAPASVAAQASSAGKTPNLIGIGAGYTSLKFKDINASAISIPLSYTIRNDIDPRRQLSFSLPITVVDMDGAKAYSGALGVSYRVPMNDQWTLTPAAQYGFVGSVDLATVAAAYSGSLTSTYVIPKDGYQIAIGNMLGMIKTAKFKGGDYSFSPDISNTVMRNGVMFTQPVAMQGKKMSLEYSLIDTRYLGGDKPFADNSQELGISIGTNKSAFDARSFLRAGFTYINAKDSKGYRLSVGYWF